MIDRQLTVQAFALLALIGCGGPPPEPLGKLPRSKLQEWAADCSSPIVEEPAGKGKDPLRYLARYRDATFQKATHRFLCKPPGWSIYVDAEDRVLGLCVDDNVRPHPIEETFERARPLISKHMGEALAADMTKGECSFEPQGIAHGLLRWEQDFPYLKNPDGSHTYLNGGASLWTCCWEVRD